MSSSTPLWRYTLTNVIYLKVKISVIKESVANSRQWTKWQWKHLRGGGGCNGRYESCKLRHGIRINQSITLESEMSVVTEALVRGWGAQWRQAYRNRQYSGVWKLLGNCGRAKSSSPNCRNYIHRKLNNVKISLIMLSIRGGTFKSNQIFAPSRKKLLPLER